MVWEAKCVPFWIKDQNGLPVGPYHLLIARSALDPTAVKFFLSNAPASTAVEVLLLVAFSRWRIERMFEDSQGQLGLDHFEVRRYGSLCRHLLLTCVSYLFLAEFCQRQKKRSATDGVPGADGDADVGGHLVWGRTVLAEAGRTDRGAIGVNAGAERGRASQSPQADNTTIARPRLQAERIDQMSLAQEVAL
jgi:hypothetical protein